MTLYETLIGNLTPYLGLTGKEQINLNYKTTVCDSKLIENALFRESRLIENDITGVIENIVEDSSKHEQDLNKNTERKLFNNYQIVLDLPPSVKMKEKQELRRKIIDNGGIVSYMVTKMTKFVICVESNLSSMKQKMAKKYEIPVLKESYIYACLESKKLLETTPFLISNETQMNGFRKGKIFVNLNVQKQPTSVQVFLSSLPIYPYKDLHGYELVKPTVLKGKSLKTSSNNIQKFSFCIIELHVSSSKKNIGEDKQFCVFIEEGHILEQDENIVESKKICYFLETAEKALSVFSQIYFSKRGAPHYMNEVMEILHPQTGSLAFQKLQLEWSSLVSHIDKNVLNLMELIWTEAIGHLKKYLRNPEYIPLWKIDEAESILLQIHSVLNEFDSEELLEKLSKEYYSILPHVSEYSQPIKSKQLVAQKRDLCQVLHDMISVSEATGWSPKGHLHAKYKALRCHIQPLSTNSEEFNKINDFVINSQFRETCIKVHNVYAVHRDIEYAEFASHISNKQLLFHSTLSTNIVGILSRGLKLPKVLLEESGVKRTDVGMLGNGIYFTNSASSCIKYSTINKMRNTRFILACEVALGKVYRTDKFQISLTSPPKGFESVHGVKTSDSEISDFQDDEFVIYDPCQQQLKYLIEFSLPEDDVKPFPEITELLSEEKYIVKGKDNHLNLDFETEDDSNTESKKKIEAGLKLINNVENIDVPLKAVDVQAKILDLVSEVIVLQVYENNNDSSVEAKYIFPVEVGAAVCGFEAFINDKHIVGEIKEKETAHKEYKEAVRAGHGAYLMDEEQPNVFTVSVGNIPPRTTVIIKITYIIELPVSDEVINFNIPGTVAPWHSQLLTETQDVTSSVNLMEMKGFFSLQISVEMPFPIHIISSPTHKIKIKRTETKAVVKLQDSVLGNGFTLSISLKEVHVPRMWIENDCEENSQVCMLTFYPEFEAVIDPHPEIIIAIDASNSMQRNLFTDAIKLAVLCLKNLPYNCYFNLVAFGSVFHELFPSSQIYNSKNVEKAINFLKQITLLGNTEFSRVLKYYQLTSGKNMKNIILLSDGDVNNESTVFKSIKSYSNKVRIFTIGLNSSAYINKHVLQQIANKSGGVYESLDSSNLKHWKNVIQKQIMRTTQASLTNIRIEWQHDGDEQDDAFQAPKQITSIFNGCRQIIYGLFNERLNFVKLKADIDGREFETVLYSSELNATEGTMLHKLAARCIIRDWEDGLLADNRVDHLFEKNSNRENIIICSKKFNLVTSLTSFIAVEKRTEGEDFSAYDSSTLKCNLLKEIDVDILPYMSFDDDTFTPRHADYGKDIDSALPALQADSAFSQQPTLSEVMSENVLRSLERDVKLIELESQAEEFESYPFGRISEKRQAKLTDDMEDMDLCLFEESCADEFSESSVSRSRGSSERNMDDDFIIDQEYTNEYIDTRSYCPAAPASPPSSPSDELRECSLMSEPAPLSPPVLDSIKEKRLKSRRYRSAAPASLRSPPTSLPSLLIEDLQKECSSRSESTPSPPPMSDSIEDNNLKRSYYRSVAPAPLQSLCTVEPEECSSISASFYEEPVPVKECFMKVGEPLGLVTKQPEVTQTPMLKKRMLSHPPKLSSPATGLFGQSADAFLPSQAEIMDGQLKKKTKSSDNFSSSQQLPLDLTQNYSALFQLSDTGVDNFPSSRFQHLSAHNSLTFGSSPSRRPKKSRESCLVSTTMSQQPTVFGSVPTAMSQQPTVFGSVPTAMSQQPTELGSVPTIISQQPTGFGLVPTIMSQQPTGFGSIPTTMSQQPTGFGSIPTTMSQQPTGFGSIPTTMSQQFTFGSPAPAARLQQSYQIPMPVPTSFSSSSFANAYSAESKSKTVTFGGVEIDKVVKEMEATQEKITMDSINDELKEWVKCKGGLPLCDFIYQNLHNKAMKENNEELLNLFSKVPHCDAVSSEPEHLDSDTSIYTDDLGKHIVKILLIINENGGFCTEANLLQVNILKNPFTLHLREAGLNSLGMKASKDIKLMLSTLAFCMFCASLFILIFRRLLTGNTEIDKLQNCAELLAKLLLKLSDRQTVLMKALKFIICTHHKYSMTCESLGLGNNWEAFILNFINSSYDKSFSDILKILLQLDIVAL